MVFRILLFVLKSALMVAFLEFLRPVADVIGLQLSFISAVAGAISRLTAIPYRESEILFLFVLTTTLWGIGRAVWALITEI